MVLRCGPLAAAADHFFTAADLRLDADDPGWGRVAAFAGVAPDDLLLVRQVHGAAVALATRDRSRPWRRPEADIVITDDPEVAIGVRTADCVPILLAEDTGRIVAAVHAGWRGLAARAPIAGVHALFEHFGVRPERLIAAIGPAIGRCCYEVGTDTRQAFAEAGHHALMLEGWFEPRRAGKFQLDTVRAAREQLEGTGVLPARIHDADLCTRTHAGVFHSYRATGAGAGRMVAVIRPAAGSRQ
jgi:YfiH family protein